MKLKTKLIPLASVAAVCATVAPLTLTSCGNNTYVDLLNNFVPTFEKLEQTYDEQKGFAYVMSELNETDFSSTATALNATQVWTDLMIQHPEYFAQEYYWTMSNAVKTVNDSKAININSNVELAAMYARMKLADLAKHQLIFNRPDELIRFAIWESGMDKKTNMFNTTYKTYQEKISDFKITTQSFKISYLNRSGQPKSLTFEIPTISYRLDFNRVSESSYNDNEDGSLWTYKSTDAGYRIFENVPVIVLNDYNSVVDSPSFVVSPFIKWASSESSDSFAYELSEALFKAGEITAVAPVTINTPDEWSITCHNDQSEDGIKSNISGDHHYNWSNVEDAVIDSDYLNSTAGGSAFDMEILAELQTLTASWYLFSVYYSSGFLSSAIMSPHVEVKSL